MMERTTRATMVRGIGLLLTVLAALGFAGCDGDNGEPGGPTPTQTARPPETPQPTPVPEGPRGEAAGTLNAEIVTVEILPGTGLLEVTFRVTDAAGRGVSNLTGGFEFTVAKLVPGSNNDPDYWQSYINRSRLQSGGAKVLRAAGERRGATDLGNGVYRYTFATDVIEAAEFQYYGSGAEPVPGSEAGVGSNGVLDSPAAEEILAELDLDFDPDAVHRIAISSRAAASVYRLNAVADFIPAELPDLLPEPISQVVTTASCGACHATTSAPAELQLPNVHGNARFDVNLCVTCHNPNTFDSRGSSDTAWAPIDLATMVHKIHSGEEGYSVDGRDYSGLTYPQNLTGVGGVLNCRACHDNQHPLVQSHQPAGRPEADAVRWKTRPSIEACGTCHGDVDFTQPHSGSVRNNNQCGTCHTPDEPGFVAVETAHLTLFSTPNNPLVPEGAMVLEYEIAEVTLDDQRRPTVRFRILADGEPLDLKNMPPGVTFGNNPNFKIIWAAPQRQPADPFDGPAFAMPADWNNLTIPGDGTVSAGRQYFVLAEAQGRRSFDQPATVTFGAALAGLDDMDAEGFFTTAPGIDPVSAVAFPSVATMQAVAIEGAFAFAGLGNISGESVVAGVGAGMASPRRTVVHIDRCTTCHERIRFHGGGGRDNNPDLCVTCHNPEMTNSGRGTVDGVTYGELSNNFKDMIHALHAGTPVGGGGIRTSPFRFIRGSSAGGGGGQGIHDFSHVGYPGQLGDCAKCHLGGTYRLPLPDDALWSTVESFEQAITPAAPHDETLKQRIPPTWTACGGCHDSLPAAAHFATNIAITSPGSHVETCVVCHGSGRLYDVDVVHAQ